MLGTFNKIQILRKILLFQGLTFDEIAGISQICKREWFEAGKVVFRKRKYAPVDSLYVVIEGEIDILIQTKRGEQIVKRVTSNEFFGEMSVFDEERRAATARAKAPSLLLKIKKDDFRELLNVCPTLSAETFNPLTGRSGKSAERNHADSKC